MDWLDVAANGIEMPSFGKNAHYNSLSFTHFLTSVDMIVESVIHIWKSICTVFDQIKPYNFESKKIFDAKEFGDKQKDLVYFKMIRSWFGIHAVNGKEIDLKKDKIKARFFSSWSGSEKFTKSYYLTLYSNNETAEKKYGGTKEVSIDKIIEFAKRYYYSLETLIKEINSTYDTIVKNLKTKRIKMDDKLNNIDKMLFLKKESDSRKLTKGNFEDEVFDYIKLLSVDLSVYSKDDRSKVENYLSSISDIPLKYKKFLEELDFDNSPDVFKGLQLDLSVFKNSSNRDAVYVIGKSLDYKRRENQPFLLLFNELCSLGLPNYIIGLEYYEYLLLLLSYSHHYSIFKFN